MGGGEARFLRENKLMTRTAVFFATLAIAAGTMLAALPAYAQPARVFVSGTGSDSNPCTYTAPCRSFAQAFSVVAANGEIDALDPAGYGPLTITGPVSIQGHGFASITQAAGGCSGPNITSCTAITINAGASDTVLLNGLLIDGQGTGSAGIVVNGAGSVQIVDCVIRYLNGVAIYAAYQLSNALVSISNTVASDNAVGIAVLHYNSVSPLVILDAITATGNSSYGVFAANTQVMLTNSNVSNNYIGVSFEGAGQVMANNSVLSNNNFAGLSALGAAWLGKTAIFNNGYGVSGFAYSFGDNTINGNGIDVYGSLTPVTPQ